MAVGESAGSVYVTIDGDISPLAAKYAQAESLSRAAGQRIGSALVSPLVDSSGRAMAAVTQISGALVGDLAPAAQKAAGATAETAVAIRAMGTAAERTVPQMAAASGAVRAAFGEQSIRAVERLITLIPGVGAVLQTAFPLIGAIALAEMITRVVGKFGDAKAAAEALASATKSADDAFFHMEDTLDHLNVEHIAEVFGAAQGKGAEKVVLEQKAKSIQLAIDDTYDHLLNVDTKANDLKIGEGTLRNLKAQLIEVQGQIDKTGESQDKLKQQQSGTSGGTQAAGKLAAINRETDAFKASADLQITLAHDAAEATIKGIEDAGSREIAEADQRVRVAQATEQTITNIQASELPKRLALIRQEGAAQAEGKSQSEQSNIHGETQNKLAAAQGDADKERAEAHAETLKAEGAMDAAYANAQRGWMKEIQDNWTKAYETITKDRDHTFLYQAEKEAKAYVESLRAAIGQAQIAETVAKAEGEVSSAKVKAAYEQQSVHSIAQEVEYRQELLVIQKQEESAELASLQAKLKAAEALEDETEKSRQALAIEQQIAALKGKSQAADIGSQAGIDKLQQNPFKELGQQFSSGGMADVQAQMAKNLATGVDGIASALARATVQGKGFGEAMVKAGKQLATSVLTTVLEAGLKRVLGSLLSLVPAFATVSGAQAASAVKAKAAAEASVLTAAGEAAAWAFESVMAALPFPVNVAVAPEVAAATFAQTEAFGAFAEGTDSAPGGMALVGEKGPEIMHVPKGAQIIPNHKIGHFADGTPGYQRAFNRLSSTSIGELHVHAHGVNNPEAFARQAVAAIPHELKRQSSSFSPYSS